jgi:predicted ATP-grasp superfamily ATP-dependent carboligase
VRIAARNSLRVFVANPRDALLRKSRVVRGLPGGQTLHAGALAPWLRELELEQAVLMACSDHWVSEVAGLDADVRARFPASVCPPEVLERFVDKGGFAQTLRELGIAHPWSQILNTEADLAAITDEHFRSAILKPRDSQPFMHRFGVKAFHVESRDDARTQLRMLVAEGFPVILQEYIPGPASHHYFVDGFVDRQGVVRTLFVRQRLRMYPLDFGNSTAMVSVAPGAASEAVAAATTLVTRTGYRGMFSAEFKRDPRDNVFKILEVNARPWWYVEFAARCGVDVCRMAYEDALDRPVAAVSTYKIGRTLVFPYYDFFACAALRQRGELSLWGWLRSWVTSMQPIFQLRDPMPGLASGVRILSGFAWRRLRRILPGRASVQPSQR